MALPKIVVRDREIVLLSGFDETIPIRTPDKRVVVIHDEDKLRQSARREHDAVAFGYVAGKWIAAA